mmetsp:Transcript_15969/g.34717  ORF Transcript_15969/g.34717 Transcript_15969/m.34717 type:complete len:333 (-) Transcript_15969:127-1125(-)|eukprot:CAMPEP_0178495692 /NCGR_PEP_ID=MMETSP0696-20121128/13686_1 /TAXON_ID=265572 /ORGANISM="Extubocellulus spinifer, Strain CCMP396" /LENGTH=332 /DNA_ID=CAMNT_0020123859 /DNA_START=188 /DNA_END=1186 /DNA_ORIENTATION=+
MLSPCLLTFLAFLAISHHVSAFAATSPLHTRTSTSAPLIRGHNICNEQHRLSSHAFMGMVGPGAGGAEAVTHSLLSSAATAVAAFSKAAVSDPSHALIAVTEIAMQTPPVAYFLVLMGAGCGAPVSEDALCIFAGTVLPTLSREKGVRLLVALYLGVVMSDVCTYFIGKSLRLGVLDPVRRKLGIMTDEEAETVCALPENATNFSPDELPAVCRPKRRRKRDRLKEKLENSGDWVGFIIRLSVGMRGPLMLLTGFSGRVTLSKFIFGSALGGVVSLGLQLLLGYSMRNNPAAVVGTVASISTVVYAGPLLIALLSSLALVVDNKNKRSKTNA